MDEGQRTNIRMLRVLLQFLGRTMLGWAEALAPLDPQTTPGHEGPSAPLVPFVPQATPEQERPLAPRSSSASSSASLAPQTASVPKAAPEHRHRRQQRGSNTPEHGSSSSSTATPEPPVTSPGPAPVEPETPPPRFVFVTELNRQAGCGKFHNNGTCYGLRKAHQVVRISWVLAVTGGQLECQLCNL